VAVPSKYGTACFGDGTNNCQGEGVCSGGVCLFKRKCAALTGDDALCNTNECDPMSGKCSLVPRLDGAACVLPNGRPKGEDFCLGNYTCHLALVGGTQKGVCDGQQLEVNIIIIIINIIINTSLFFHHRLLKTTVRAHHQ